MHECKAFFLVIIAFFAATCAEGPPSQGGVDTATQRTPGTILAKVGAAVITVEDFKEELKRLRGNDAKRYADLEARRELLDEQIRRELLVQEAKRRGMHELPFVRRGFKNMLVRELRRVLAEQAPKLEDVSEAEIKAFYDAHPDDYHKPAAIRAAHIYFAFGDDGKDAAHEKAREALKKIKAMNGKREEFRNLAYKESEDAETRKNGGDLGFRSRKDYEDDFGPAVAEAVFGLGEDAFASDIVEGKSGYHIFMIMARREPIDYGLDQVRRSIPSRVISENRSKTVDDLVEELRSATEISIDNEQLKAIDLSNL